MTLHDPSRAEQAFAIDEAVKRALSAWGKEHDAERGRFELTRALEAMSDEQRLQLRERLAEISLGLLFVLERSVPKSRKRGRR